MTTPQDVSQSNHVPSLADETQALDWFARMREHHPVWVDDAGMWHIFGQAEVCEVMRDTTRFSSNLGWVFHNAPTPGGNLAIDPPEHGKLRSLVSAAFTPRRISDLEPRIREITRELLDDAGQEFDLIADVADPLPLAIVSELLGLSPEDRDYVRTWMDAISDASAPFADSGAMEEGAAVFPKFITHLAGICAARRADPADDLISALVTTEVDGHTLSDQDAGTFAMGLFIAGHGTTTGLISNAIRTLNEQPELWEAVHTDRGRIPDLVEEVLRLRPSAPELFRATTCDTEVGGTTIPAKSLVGVWLLAANHDPAVYDDPDRFDLQRGVRGAKQLGFGHGVHFCLGAPLARMEARIALEEILDRHGRLVIETDRSLPHGGLEPHEHTNLGVRRLPVQSVSL